MRGTCRRTSFFQLGLWRDAAAAGSRGVRRIRPRGSRARQLGPAMRNYHALSWLQYELLQRGRYREASGDHRRARAGRQSERRAAAAQRSVVDARATTSIETRRLDAAWPRETQLRQRQRPVRHRRERRARAATRISPSAPVRRSPSARSIRAAKAICARRSRSWSARSPALIALAAGRTDEAVETLQAAARRGAAAPAAARPADTAQAGAGAARRGAARGRPAARGDRTVRAGAAPEPEPIAVGPRPRPRRGGDRRR